MIRDWLVFEHGIRDLDFPFYGIRDKTHFPGFGIAVFSSMGYTGSKICLSQLKNGWMALEFEIFDRIRRDSEFVILKTRNPGFVVSRPPYFRQYSELVTYWMLKTRNIDALMCILKGLCWHSFKCNSRD